ncbi:hypothetical protein PENTCL1PPCAC_22197, partial [Pristionchus entomophagus]
LIFIASVNAVWKGVKVRGRVTCEKKVDGHPFTIKIEGAKIELWENDENERGAGEDDNIAGATTDYRGQFKVYGGQEDAYELGTFHDHAQRFYLKIFFPCKIVKKKCDKLDPEFAKYCEEKSGDELYPWSKRIDIPSHFYYTNAVSIKSLSSRLRT